MKLLLDYPTPETDACQTYKLHEGSDLILVTLEHAVGLERRLALAKDTLVDLRATIEAKDDEIGRLTFKIEQLTQ